MKRPLKQYIVWVHSDGGYQPYEYDTVEECLLHDKYGSDWYLTEAINTLTAWGNFNEPAKAEDHG